MTETPQRGSSGVPSPPTSYRSGGFAVVIDPAMPPRTTASVPVASRISGFVYAIRNIVAEARKVEAAGRKVRYLNIGDPITFGFQDAAAPGRGGRARDPGRTQRLRAVGRHRAGARGGRRRVPAAWHAARPRSRRHHRGHVRRHRAGADRARRTGRRSAGPGADLSALYRRARQDRRPAGVLRHDARQRTGCRTPARFDG